MKREFTYLITTEYSGTKVYDFLIRQGFSKQNLIDIRFKDYGIYVNAGRVFRNHILTAGDTLNVVIDEQENSANIIPSYIPIDIVYEDEDILVVNKSANMPVHPSLNNPDNSLGNAVMNYYNSQGICFVYRCINRLDRDTSGLVIIAKNVISASILGNMQLNSEIKKEYIAIVDGDTKESGTITYPIGRVDNVSIKRQVDIENGKPAITHFTKLRSINGMSVIKLRLETGRTHQIRVHMKAIGHPLIGDKIYNPDDKRLDRQALHVSKLSFLHPITGQQLEFVADMPEDMRVALEETL